MTQSQSYETGDILKQIGFGPDSRVYSDIQPGLSFEFGNFTLSASAVLSGWQLNPVVLFTGVMQDAMTIAQVQFEMPRRIESLDLCVAWIAWHLDQHCDGEFQPAITTSWLLLGRSCRLLLPWVIDTEAYDLRPVCSVDRDWARMMIKRLRSALESAKDDDIVSFDFDGEILRIFCGKQLVPGAANGKAWEDRYSLKASQIWGLPRRLKYPEVSFSIWKDRLEIDSYSYEGVMAESKH